MPGGGGNGTSAQFAAAMKYYGKQWKPSKIEKHKTTLSKKYTSDILEKIHFLNNSRITISLYLHQNINKLPKKSIIILRWTLRNIEKFLSNIRTFGDSIGGLLFNLYGEASTFNQKNRDSRGPPKKSKPTMKRMLTNLGTALAVYAASVLPAKALEIKQPIVTNQQYVETNTFYPEDSMNLDYILDNTDAKLPVQLNRTKIAVSDASKPEVRTITKIADAEVSKEYALNHGPFGQKTLTIEEMVAPFSMNRKTAKATIPINVTNLSLQDMWVDYVAPNSATINAVFNVPGDMSREVEITGGVLYFDSGVHEPFSVKRIVLPSTEQQPSLIQIPITMQSIPGDVYVSLAATTPSYQDTKYWQFTIPNTIPQINNTTTGIHGIIRDLSDAGVANQAVNLVKSGSEQAALTNSNGEFTISVPDNYCDNGCEMRIVSSVFYSIRKPIYSADVQENKAFDIQMIQRAHYPQYEEFFPMSNNFMDIMRWLTQTDPKYVQGPAYTKTYRFRDEDLPIKSWLNFESLNVPYTPSTNPYYNQYVQEIKNGFDEWNTKIQQFMPDNKKDFKLFTYTNPDGSLIASNPTIGLACYWHPEAGNSYITHFDESFQNGDERYPLHNSIFVDSRGSPTIERGGITYHPFQRTMQHELGWASSIFRTYGLNNFITGYPTINRKIQDIEAQIAATWCLLNNNTDMMQYVYDVPTDSDNDGLPDYLDNCPNKPNSPSLGTCSATSDKPGINCTTDADCANGCSSNGLCIKDQRDSDSDGKGDLCDNCPTTCNTQQLDADTDGIGDVCDPSPGCGGCGTTACEQGC